jgi:hypothetical protein
VGEKRGIVARKSFFNKMADKMLRQAINESKRALTSSLRGASSQSKPPKIDAASTRYRTAYSLPSSTVQLASRGMHAYPVSGESFYPANFSVLNVGHLQNEMFTRAFLIPDSLNPADSNAVAVAIEGLSQALVVGHIPRHTASAFANYLQGRTGECGARVYFSPDGMRNSVELDCAFPPRESGEPEVADANLLSSDSPDFSMTQVTTVGGDYAKQDLIQLGLEKEQTRYGIAILREGFMHPTEISDSQNLKLLGYPYKTIAWDFNIFTRSYGGEVRVAYKLDLNEKGRPRLALDASRLPEFKKSQY